MKKTKTQEIVYGAMMLAIYAVVMLLDRYSGGMLYLFFYYFLPLPFIIYGLKFDTKMFGALLFGTLVLGLIFGLPETAFFGFTAVIVAYVIVSSIQKNWTGTSTMLLIMLVTVGSQILSVTLFAALFGYNLASEVQAVIDTVSEISTMMPANTNILSAQQIKVIFAFSTILMGCLEAFLFTTLSDLVLIRLKMARVQKFSIIQLHFPKIVGILFVIFFYLQIQMPSDLVLFLYLTFFMMMLAQGVSYCFFLNALVWRKPIINTLAFLGCFLPMVNYFILGMGLIDIFSDNRKKFMYNINQRGE